MTRGSAAFPDRNIVLAGLPGAGKTNVGQALADHLGWRFVDTDREIEERSGLSIAAIFDRIGECGFRELEAEIVAEVAIGHGTMIALGGGAFSHDGLRDLVQRRCVTIWLDPPFEILLSRVRSSSKRPLFAGADHREVLEKLAATRRPALEQAHIRITDMSCESAVESISIALARRTMGAGA